MYTINPKVFKGNHKSAFFPPNYAFDKDIYVKNPEGFNCYAYAMQFTIPVKDRLKGYYTPGFLCGMTPKGRYTKNIVVPCFLADCEYLGLKVEETTIDAPLIKAAYKVIVWYSNCSFSTFHFMRQNEDGRWSEVVGWGENPEVYNRIYCYRGAGDYNKVFSLSRK